MWIDTIKTRQGTIRTATIWTVECESSINEATLRSNASLSVQDGQGIPPTNPSLTDMQQRDHVQIVRVFVNRHH